MSSLQMPYYLDPLNQALANLSAGIPGADMLSVQQVRDGFKQSQEHEKVSGVNRTKIVVPVSNGTDTWIYTPEGAEGPLPYVFYVHGGGYVAGE
jgi:acetyl esterase/lipase